MKLKKNYYFELRNVTEGKRTVLRVFPLDCQTLITTGEKVDSKKFVTRPSAWLSGRSEGEIYYSTELNLGKTGNYYVVPGVLGKVNKDVEIPKDLAELMMKISDKKTIEESAATVEVDVVTVLQKIRDNKKLVMPSPKKDGYYIDHKDWELMVRNIDQHVNTMLIGATGTGKTSMVKEICKRMGKTLHIFDMGSMIDPISSLLGVHRLISGKSVFDYAKFTQVIQEPCVILLDELSRCPAGVWNILFPCLDDRRKLSIEIAGGKDIREINIHPEVTFIATANIGSEYTGTQSIDKALMNRFFPLELGILPVSAEESVLSCRTGITPESSKLVVKIANNIRNMAKKEEISTSLSVRETLMVANLVKDGWGIGEAMEKVYLPMFEGDLKTGERSIVYNTISSY